jgi:flagellar motor switch protein FliN/FliY
MEELLSEKRKKEQEQQEAQELEKNITRKRIEAIINERARWMDFDNFLDMQICFSADLGETSLSLKEILQLNKGSIINLEKPAGESVEVYVNKRIIGRGEVMVYEKNLAIRMNEVLDANGVVYSISKESLR